MSYTAREAMCMEEGDLYPFVLLENLFSVSRPLDTCVIV